MYVTDIFHVQLPVIGPVHLPPLPGSPGGERRIELQARHRCSWEAA